MKENKLKLINLDYVDSTSKQLKILIKKNKKINNLCISSNIQSNGYGRRNSKWCSYFGNLHFSILIKPNCYTNIINQISFLTAVSLGEVIKKISNNKSIKYKWPNDILINKKKVSGIIIETTSNNKKKINWVIIGIGVNIREYPVLKKNELQATSLNKEKIFVEKDVLLKLFLKNFSKHYIYWKKNGFNKVKKKWLLNLYSTNNKVSIKFKNKKVVGDFFDLLDDGSLKIIINKQVKKLSFGNQIV